MLTQNHSQPTPIPRPRSLARERLRWTLANLLMFIGVYLLLYVGGLYVEIEYERQSARGDSDLSLLNDVYAHEIPAATTNAVQPFPQSNLADGSISSDLPSGSQLSHVSSVERLVIPSIALDYKVVEVGWSNQEIDGQTVALWDVANYAVGHHRGSANPGEGGNVVLTGHVGGYGHVFRDLFYVHPGEPVIISSGGQQFHYVIYDRLIVDEDGAPPEQRTANAKLIAPTNYEVITMVTCWPPNGPDKFTQRVIVRAVPFSITMIDTSPNAPPVQSIR
ncbi:sortase [Candidatus Oscillochloris fontis]|uniref:sortase n=1 Tax=Candidatus Oscillochloris fontis TaxID=2496868 RepID=UPI00101BD639|nr:sortase [Candidatus Oscillochloris fontis]